MWLCSVNFRCCVYELYLYECHLHMCKCRRWLLHFLCVFVLVQYSGWKVVAVFISQVEFLCQGSGGDLSQWKQHNLQQHCRPLPLCCIFVLPTFVSSALTSEQHSFSILLPVGISRSVKNKRMKKEWEWMKKIKNWNHRSDIYYIIYQHAEVFQSKAVKPFTEVLSWNF